MKRKNKSLVKTIAMWLSLSFSMLACFIGTLAWFTATHLNKIEGYDFTVQNSEELSIDYKLFHYNYDSKAGENVDMDVDAHKLGQYDPYIVERNAYVNRIARVEISFNRQCYDTEFLHIEIPCTGAYMSGESIANNISNVIQFKFVVDSITDLDGNTYKYSYPTSDGTDTEIPNKVWDESRNVILNPDPLYKTSKSIFDCYEEIYTYFDWTMWEDERDKVWDVLDVTIFEFIDNCSTMTLYIEYNYNELLVNDFYDKDSDNSDWKNAQEVEFLPDLSYIKFYIGA